MPRRKNCFKAWARNLPPKPVEEPFSDSEDNEFFPNGSSDEEFPSSDEEELESAELKNEADLLLFLEKLQMAHDRLVAEQKALHRKRPRHYTKNSERSKKRHRQQKREMEKKGFQSVDVFFKLNQCTGSQKPDSEPEVREFCFKNANPSN